jgi:hypothetical protein
MGFMHLASIKDLSRFDVMAHEDPILKLLFLRSQEIAECDRRNLEVTTQLINRHIDLTSLFRVNKPSSIQKATVSFLPLRWHTDKHGHAVLIFSLRFLMKSTNADSIAQGLA